MIGFTVATAFDFYFPWTWLEDETPSNPTNLVQTPKRSLYGQVRLIVYLWSISPQEQTTSQSVPPRRLPCFYKLIPA